VVYRFEDVSSLAGIYRNPRLDAAFAAFVDRQVEPFDVAHVHHLTGVSVGVLDRLRERGIPVALTLHDYWLMCPRGQMWHRRGEACAAVEPARCADCLSSPFGAWLPAASARDVVAALHADARAALAQPQALIVPSARAIPPFQALGVPAHRIRAVANGVDTAALRAVSPAARDDLAPLRVGYLGTLIPSKGLDLLVDAVQRLAGAVELHVFGNAVPYHGDEGFLTRCFGSLAAGAPVTYHGPYRMHDLPRILGELDLVAAPSRWAETFGLTVREALAAGRPVVASRIGGLAEAIDDGVEGLLVPPDDAGALAAAIGRLARDRGLWRRMAAAAARRGTRGFAAMTDELLEIYRSLTSRAHVP
jgi:glycosyltransferase involved in cell wall biosynthesis